MNVENVDSNNKYLIVGGDSQIGQALAASWKAIGRDFHYSTRRKDQVSSNRPYIDLDRQIKKHQLIGYGSSVICAAESRVILCENHVERTRKINVESTVQLANYLIDAGSYVLFISSNRVFNGLRPNQSKHDLVDPCTEYGRQKVQAENLILKKGNSGVLRITKVQKDNDELSESWRNSLEQGNQIFPFRDILISPVSQSQVTKTITSMLNNSTAGIFHLGGIEEISYAQLAYRYCSHWGLDSSLVVPIAAPKSALMPRYSSLI